MKLINFLDKKLEEMVLVAFLLIMILLVFLQVISRYIADFPMGWSQEVSRFILVWIAWISASYAVQQGSHIRVEFLSNKIKGKPKAAFELLVLIIWFIFSAILAFFGTEFILDLSQRMQTSPSLDIPMYIIYLAVPVAGVLMCFRLIQQMYFIIKKEKTP